MRRSLKWALVPFSVFAVGSQVVSVPRGVQRQPAQTGTFVSVMGPEAGAIVQRSCKDCHSNETTWPWYSHFAPVSWIVARDVKRGREKVNFSNWSSRKHSANEVEELCDAVRNRSMPPGAYRLMHPKSELSVRDVEVMCRWADLALAQESAGRTDAR
jgi:hypothetical protein